VRGGENGERAPKKKVPDFKSGTLFLYKPDCLDQYDILCLRALLALRDGEFDLLAFNE
jgi:hypothetical protein